MASEQISSIISEVRDSLAQICSVLESFRSETYDLKTEMKNLKTEIISKFNELEARVCTELNILEPIPTNTAIKMSPGLVTSDSSRARFQALLAQISDESDRRRVHIKLGFGETADTFSSGAPTTVIEAFISSVERRESTARAADLGLFLQCDVSFLEQCVITSEEQSNFLLQLTSKPENEIQAKLRDVWFQSGDSYCCAIDTNARNYNAPFYLASNSDNISGDTTSSSSSGNSNVHRIAGKPDFASLALSMTLEMKGHSKKGSSRLSGCLLTNHAYQALSQAVERVWTTCLQNELIRRVFSFATTGSRSWLVYCERKYAPFADKSHQKVLVETFHVIPIEASIIIPLWRAVTKAALEDPSYYLHSDVFFLRDILRQMKLDIAYCRIFIIAVSGAAVYGISSHRVSGKTLMGFSAEADFAVKIHRRPHQGRAELRALKMLMGCQKAAKYVIATFQYSGDPSDSELLCMDFHAARQQLSETSSSSSVSSSAAHAHGQGITMFSVSSGNVFSLKSVPSDEKCLSLPDGSQLARPWWEFTPPEFNTISEKRNTKRAKVTSSDRTDERPNTAVLMHVGSTTLKWSEAFRDSLFKQLNEMHSQNVFHTDMRPANLLGFYFSTNADITTSGNTVTRTPEFCIIDFDCAVCVESSAHPQEVEVDISCPGSRKDTILKCVTSDEIDPARQKVKWYATSEFLMVSRAMFQLDLELKSIERSMSRSRSLHSDMESERKDE